VLSEALGKRGRLLCVRPIAVDRKDDALPVLFGRVSVGFELDRLSKVFDGKFKDVFFWVLVAPIEVFEWFVVIESIISLRRLLLFRAL